MRSQTGLSLIEILISFFLLSIMLLSLDAMQLTALQHAKEAYFFSVATEQMQSMKERILATDKHQLQTQLQIWNEQNQKILPQAHSELSAIGNNYSISLSWGKKNLFLVIQK